MLYAINVDCAEHEPARDLVDRAVSESDEWIVADQVYFELYGLLRNPNVLRSPLPAFEAAKTIDWYRMRSGWLHCAYEPGMMARIARIWADDSFAPRTTFDLVLAVTLAAVGVEEFFTRNTADFDRHEMFSVHNPIDG